MASGNSGTDSHEKINHLFTRDLSSTPTPRTQDHVGSKVCMLPQRSITRLNSHRA